MPKLVSRHRLHLDPWLCKICEKQEVTNNFNKLYVHKYMRKDSIKAQSNNVPAFIKAFNALSNYFRRPTSRLSGRLLHVRHKSAIYIMNTLILLNALMLVQREVLQIKLRPMNVSLSFLLHRLRSFIHYRFEHQRIRFAKLISIACPKHFLLISLIVDGPFV